MVEAVLAFPDQARQLSFVEELALDPQRIGRGGNHAGHHRAREIDRPEARIETLDIVGMLPASLAGEPENHRLVS